MADKYISGFFFFASVLLLALQVDAAEPSQDISVTSTANVEMVVCDK